jgi:hypothetical protein
MDGIPDLISFPPEAFGLVMKDGVRAFWVGNLRLTWSRFGSYRVYCLDTIGVDGMAYREGRLASSFDLGRSVLPS